LKVNLHRWTINANVSRPPLIIIIQNWRK